MRKVILLLLLISSVTLFATEKEDLLFIKALYQNNHYQLALDEANAFLIHYPNSSLLSDIMLLKSKILMQKEDYQASELILKQLEQKALSPAMVAEVTIAMAEVKYASKDYDLASSYINDFLQKFPNHPEQQNAYYLLGNIENEKRNYDRADAYYLQSHAIKYDIRVDLKRIEMYLNQEKFDQADSLFLDLSKKSVNKSEIDFANLLMLKKYEAIKDWQRIIQSVPDQIKAENKVLEEKIYLKSNALIEMKEYERAIDFLNQSGLTSERKEYFHALALLKLDQISEGLQKMSDLAESAKDFEVRSISFFQMISIQSQSNPEIAIEKLNQFLVEYPNQKWVADINYQIAFNYFRKKNFNDAITYLDRALSFGLNAEMEEKAKYLKGESLFLLFKKTDCVTLFSDFVQQYPQSQFKDEALFKLAVSLYQSALMDSSEIFFNQLISDFPNSNKVGMSNYYLGEIKLASAHYSQAKTYFESALSGNTDQGVIQLRLSYIEYLRKNYTGAKEAIKNVPEEEDYLFDKNLLRGNIAFAEKSYTEAINHYKKAEKNAPDQLSLEHLWSRQAWTYYRLKQYDQASRIYKQLSEQSSAPGKYMLSAASAAYNAEDYSQALSLYQQYLQENPGSKESYKAQGGIANAYFNLGNYQEAINQWEVLVDIAYPQVIIENSIQGIQWSYQYLNNKNEFVKWINEKIRKSSNNQLKVILYEFKIKFEYDQEEYRNSISSIQQLFKQFPDKKNDEHLQVMLANNYVWLKRYNSADSIYVNLVLKNNDPGTFYEWGHIKWAQQDTTGALKRYKKAADSSKQEDFWLTLLEKQVLAKDPDFDKYYTQFMSTANPYYQEQAKLILAQKKISLADYASAKELLISLDASDNPLIRVKALYQKAYISYLEKNLDLALKDFLRIRYVFTEYTDLRWDSEYYICMIYIEKESIEEARTLFEEIKDKIKSSQADSISSKLKGRE